MLKQLLTLLIAISFSVDFYAQPTFDFTLEINPITISGLPGIHSYAYAQDNGKWLIIGGRRDGLHARQPFNAFPQSNNNTEAFVIDVENQQYWSASLSQLPQAIYEQLQSTNMNFTQLADTLYIIGGYAYSQSADDHLTFPNLTTVIVSEVIDAIINQSPVSSYFKQIIDYDFAVAGGQLGVLNNTFYLVGGHQFDGNYNPMGNPTYTQTYTNQIRKFTVNNSNNQLSYANYEEVSDPLHLHRRDFNLLPQIFPDGTSGFSISSGVFQLNEDLPFLYPVDITEQDYTPIIGFNQYLSNYHCAHASLFDAQENVMHNLFFGGMSQYYYQNGNLIQDDLVPFVKTISRLSRDSDGNLYEFQLPIEMPGLRGASAEFIANRNIEAFDSDIFNLNEIEADTFVLGHIFGGIESNSLNPFSSNQTSTTTAGATIYEVKLIREISMDVQQIDGSNPYDFNIYPNPAVDSVHLTYMSTTSDNVGYFISTIDGKIVQEGQFSSINSAEVTQTLQLDKEIKGELLITLVFENKFFVTKRVNKQ